ncbi:Protein CBG25275 [Caenorhabditis briggsae]|uniref:Protein CBG25275 n=1 Tax=Caenorhabditis briggsae TaxID=6238 RepID=B6IIJ3_CAEBR|nr:Protein CBG25275 [Caenorhabditis briggsae]CAR99723.1 Protein CBG25275 [Caenorhabditis briggsae]
MKTTVTYFTDCHRVCCFFHQTSLKIKIVDSENLTEKVRVSQ